MPIRIQQQDFDLSAEIAQLRAGDAGIGAVVSFVGTVRELHNGPGLTAMLLEHYPGMTERALQDIVGQARQRWPVSDILVIHRIGMLNLHDQIVLVAVTAAHRGVAFAACEFVIDYLKSQAPFWKKEYTADGSHWVAARSSDEQAMQQWDEEIAGKDRGHT